MSSGSAIGMIQHAEAMFEGVGNLGTPDDPQALPWFTPCRLTPRGVRLADVMLGQHPEYWGGPDGR